MKTCEIHCWNCGSLNKGLLLDDSGGLCECDRCGRINRVMVRERGGYGVDPYTSCDGMPGYGGRLRRRRNLLESGVF